MGRLAVVLAVLLMLSAISLVTARFQSRQLFVMTEMLSSKERDLETDWRRLQLERAELARNARTDLIARKELGMTSVGGDRIIYIEDATATTGGGR